MEVGQARVTLAAAFGGDVTRDGPVLLTFQSAPGFVARGNLVAEQGGSPFLAHANTLPRGAAGVQEKLPAHDLIEALGLGVKRFGLDLVGVVFGDLEPLLERAAAGLGLPTAEGVDVRA